MEHPWLVCVVWVLLLLAVWPADAWVTHFTPSLPPKSVLRAVDTVLHGIIGALSWLIVCLLSPDVEINLMPLISYFLSRNTEHKDGSVVLNAVCNVVLAFCVAAFPDIDHIISAIVLYLQGRHTVYWQRSWLHYSLPPLIVCMFFWISGRIWQKINYIQVGYLILICIISHHIRDAVHHGLWFQPLYSLPPFPTWLYITLTLILPLIVALSSKLLLNYDFVTSLRTQGNKYLRVSVV